MGVSRQLDSLRELARDRGWDVVAELVDNDRSAYGKRPAFSQLLDMVRAGEVDRVAVWHLSRLVRSRPERAALIDMFGAHRVGIAAVQGPELDLSNAYSRGLIDVMTAFDSIESEVKGERVAAAAAERRAAGMPNGPLGFGWTRRDDGRYVIDRAAARIVREVVQRVGSGQSVRSVARDLTDRGVPSPYGRDTWGPSSVKKLATRASSAGLLVHAGTVLGPGKWPALVTVEQRDAVLVALARNARRPDLSQLAVNGPAHLLTAYRLGRCGVCGSSLRVKPDGRGRPIYQCNGRGHVGRDRDAVDDLTARTVVAYLSRPEHRRALTRRTPRVALTAEQEQAVDAADALLGLGRISREVHAELTADVATATVHVAPGVVRRAAARPSAVWEAASLAERVDLLRALEVTVTINRQARGPWVDLDSVAVTFGASS